MAWWNKPKEDKQQADQGIGLRASMDAELRKEQAAQTAIYEQERQQQLAKEEAAKQSIMPLLKSQLFYCFGAKANPTTNPTQVDGIWIGLQKCDMNGDGNGNYRSGQSYESRQRDNYFSETTLSGIEPDFRLTLCLYVPCKKCGNLRILKRLDFKDWDQTKKHYQEAYSKHTYLPMKSVYSWEDMWADGHHEPKRQSGESSKKYWARALEDYQVKKNWKWHVFSNSTNLPQKWTHTTQFTTAGVNPVVPFNFIPASAMSSRKGRFQKSEAALFLFHRPQHLGQTHPLCPRDHRCLRQRHIRLTPLDQADVVRGHPRLIRQVLLRFASRQPQPPDLRPQPHRQCLQREAFTLCQV